MILNLMLYDKFVAYCKALYQAPYFSLFVLVVAFAKCQQKKKNLPTSPVLGSDVYKTISAAEARISTTSTHRSYISAMLLPLKSLLFFSLDIFEPLTCRVSNSQREITLIL